MTSVLTLGHLTQQYYIFINECIMIYEYTLKTLFTQLQLCPFSPLYYTDILILLMFNYIHFIHICINKS